MPTAQKKQGDERAGHRDVNVFSHVEHGELQRGVLGVIPGNDFRLCFREIERQPVRLGECGDQENEEPQGHRRDVPD